MSAPPPPPASPVPPQPPWPPTQPRPRQPRPPRRPWYTNINVTLPISAVVALAAICAATLVIVSASEPQTGTLVFDPGVEFENAEAVELDYTYTAPDGTTATGQFTVTADGYATGSVIDQFGGAATVHTTPEGSAVWGDEDWWSRRAPGQAAQAKDQWVQPDPGTALPIDLAAEFTPALLADLIRTIGDHGRVDPDLVAYQGISAVAITWEDWTLIRTDESPIEVLSLSGPVSADLFHTAAAPRASVEAAPAIWDGGDHVVGHALVGGGYGMLRFVPSPLPAEWANLISGAASNTMEGKDPSAETAEPSAPAEIAPPPPLEALPPLYPEFTATINAPYCTTPTCSVSVTVSNNGTGAGTAEVTTSVIPGLSPVTDVLGPIAPGGSATTSTKTIPNPAPTPAPGQTTTGTAQVLVSIYSREIGGTSPERYNLLLEKLGGPSRQPALDRLLAPLTEIAKDAVVEAMHRMLEDEVPVNDTIDAMEQATQADPARGEYADTPLLQRLAEAGDRFTSWESVAQRLDNIDAVELPAYLPGLETAVQELANPAAPTVSLTYIPGEAEAPMDAVVVSEYPTPEELRCTGITTVPNGELAAAIDRAVGNAAGAAEACTVSVRVHLPDSLAPLGTAGARTLIERLHAEAPNMTGCGDGGRFDRATIVNEAGVWAWTAPEICLATLEEIEKEALRTLNDLPQNIRDRLRDDKIVTLDATGAVTEINWKDTERRCAPKYDYTPAEPEEFGSTSKRKGGIRALGAHAYLCEPLDEGQDPMVDPWDFPDPPVEIAPNTYAFSRCHLIGKQFGGYGQGDNLVTCYQHPNREMANFENSLRRSVGKESHLVYIVFPYYNGPADPGRLPSLGGIYVVAISQWMVISGAYPNTPDGEFQTDGMLEVD